MGVAMRPLSEETNTTRPREERSRGSTAWVTAACPTTFTSSWRRRSSGATSSTGPATTTPALLTTASSAAGESILEGRDLGRVGDVELHRADPRTPSLSQRLAVGAPADPGDHVPPRSRQVQRGPSADPRPAPVTSTVGMPATISGPGRR